MISELVHMAKHGQALWRYTCLVSGVLCITMEQVLKLPGLLVGSLAITLTVYDANQNIDTPKTSISHEMIFILVPPIFHFRARIMLSMRMRNQKH